MRVAALLAPALVVAGAGAIALAVLEGSAHAAVVVVVPVVYGSSLLFLLGFVLIVAGLFALPLTLPAVPLAASAEEAAAGGGSGGVVLIGPLPIFWGSAAGASRRARVAAAVAGGLALAIAVLVLVALARG